MTFNYNYKIYISIQRLATLTVACKVLNMLGKNDRCYYYNYRQFLQNLY